MFRIIESPYLNGRSSQNALCPPNTLTVTTHSYCRDFQVCDTKQLVYHVTSLRKAWVVTWMPNREVLIWVSRMETTWISVLVVVWLYRHNSLFAANSSNSFIGTRSRIWIVDSAYVFGDKTCCSRSCRTEKIIFPIKAILFFGIAIFYFSWLFVLNYGSACSILQVTIVLN